MCTTLEEMALRLQGVIGDMNLRRSTNFDRNASPLTLTLTTIDSQEGRNIAYYLLAFWERVDTA